MPYLYKRIRISKDKTRDRHRLIMEEILGRKLTYDEIVHHKNGNHGDDSPENLEVISRSKHSSLHRKKTGISEEHKNAFKNSWEGKPRTYQAKLSPGDIANIRSLVEKGFTMRFIGDIYGVSHTTISRAISGKTLSYKV